MNDVVKNWKANFISSVLTMNIKLINTFKVLFLSLVCLYTSGVMAGMSGAQLYMQNCMVCHADDGSGAMPGVSDLTENIAWLTIDEGSLLSKLKQGIQKKGATMSMPAKGGNPDLTDDDLRGMIRYMRQTFIK